MSDDFSHVVMLQLSRLRERARGLPDGWRKAAALHVIADLEGLLKE